MHAVWLWLVNSRTRPWCPAAAPPDGTALDTAMAAFVQAAGAGAELDAEELGGGAVDDVAVDDCAVDDGAIDDGASDDGASEPLP